MIKAKKHIVGKGVWKLYLLALAVIFLTIFGFYLNGSDFLADSSSTGQIAPPLFTPIVEDCNLGLIGACNDSGDYVEGPESVLKTWIFSTALPWWISFFLALTAGVSVLVIMIGGGMILVAGGNEELRGKGVKTVTWALLGLLIALFSFAIVAILENLPLPGSTAENLK